MIRKETQFESFKLLEVSERKTKILSALGINELTAREIAHKLNFDDLNAVKPRLTELCEQQLIMPVGKKFDVLTGRKVSVYKVVS